MMRLLFIIAAIVLVFLIIKNQIAARRHKVQQSARAATENMVQCVQCHTYVPTGEAITSGEQTFCCKQHQRDWQDRQH
jgi:uncharacterized protein